MLTVSPYISNVLGNPVAKPYNSIESIINDNRLSYREKEKLLDKLAMDLGRKDMQMRNGMFFDYSRAQDSTLKEIENAKNNLQNSYA